MLHNIHSYVIHSLRVLPLCFRATCLNPRLLLLRLLPMQSLDECFTQFLREAQQEDHTVLCLLHLAVCRGEEACVSASAVLRIRVEMARARFVGHHPSLLTCFVTARHDVLSQLERTRKDVDATVLAENCLCLHLEVVDEYLILHNKILPFDL